MEYNYKAFISYRHAKLDMKVAAEIQNRLERYTIPGSIRKEYGLKKIGSIFRDKDELPSTNDLTDYIKNVLTSSEYLICICSPQYLKSVWCRRELEFFLQTHDKAHVLTVLAEGDPHEVIPEILCTETVTSTDENGNTVTTQTELDALQSQINPHFLYNTLDSVVWMIEGGHDRGAVYMIRQLASLLRISISHGKTIITIRDEIRHAQSYMNIQQIRYKNAFEISYEIPEEIMDLCTVKLILQPILENAIYYGVQSMDGDGEILVRGSREGSDVYLDVIDNGLGMPEEQVEKLLESSTLEEEENSTRHGNGVGLYNVHTRIQLRFGKEYGLVISSEPDEGTQVRIHLPAIAYRPDIEKILDGKIGGNDEEEI